MHSHNNTNFVSLHSHAYPIPAAGPPSHRAPTDAPRVQGGGEGAAPCPPSGRRLCGQLAPGDGARIDGEPTAGPTAGPSSEAQRSRPSIRSSDQQAARSHAVAQIDPPYGGRVIEGQRSREFTRVGPPAVVRLLKIVGHDGQTCAV